MRRVKILKIEDLSLGIDGQGFGFFYEPSAAEFNTVHYEPNEKLDNTQDFKDLKKYTELITRFKTKIDSELRSCKYLDDQFIEELTEITDYTLNSCYKALEQWETNESYNESVNIVNRFLV